MTQPSITVKLQPHAHRLLRVIAAVTGEKHYALILRLLEAEAKQISLKIPKEPKLPDMHNGSGDGRSAAHKKVASVSAH